MTYKLCLCQVTKKEDSVPNEGLSVCWIGSSVLSIENSKEGFVERNCYVFYDELGYFVDSLIMHEVVLDCWKDVVVNDGNDQMQTGIRSDKEWARWESWLAKLDTYFSEGYLS